MLTEVPKRSSAFDEYAKELGSDPSADYAKKLDKSSQGSDKKPEGKPIIKDLEDYNYKIYGMLLSNGSTHNLSQVVDNNWMEIHKMTGDEFLLIAFQAPKNWNEHYKDELKQIVGDSFEQYWKESEPDALRGRSYDFLDKFEPKIELSQLPCLVLFTDPKKDKPDAVVRTIPNWDERSLYEFLSKMLWTIREISNQKYDTDDERLYVLRDKLNNPTAEAMDYYEYAKDKTVDYLRQNPAKIVKASASFVITIATGNIIILSPVVVELLKTMKTVL
jgi:hypothetical protein